MIQREIEIKLRNTKLKFQIQYRPEQKVIDILNKLIFDLKLPQNTSIPKLYYKGACLDNSKTLDQQGIIQINIEAEVEFIEKIVVTVNNQILDKQNLKCEIITSLNELGSILLKKLNFNQDYYVRFAMDGRELNKAKNLIEIAPWENLTFQILSHNYFIYDSAQYQLEIDVTKSIQNLCEMISQMININSDQIQIDSFNKEDPFYYYQVNPNTELKLRIEDIQNNNQVTISIVYGQITHQMKILKDEKLETLINKTKTSFFPHNYSSVNVKLVFNGIELANNNTINSYQIVNNSVIQLIVTNMLEKIQICIQNKENPVLKKKTKISLDEQLSCIDRDVFFNKQMDYFYQDKQLDKKQTFRQQQITKNDTIIEYKPIEGVQLLIKFKKLDEQNPVEVQVQSNELLSKYIYQLIGRETNDVWVSCKNQTINDIKQTFSALQIQNDLIFYQPQQILLKVQYKDNLYDIYQKRDLCVIDLYNNLRNYFEIDEQQEFELQYGNEIVQGQLLCKKLWASCQECYKILLIENGQNDRNTKLYKIYFINQDKYIELNMNPDKKIGDLQREFLQKQEYPKNQPIECYMKNNTNITLNKEDLLNTLNEDELQIQVKDIINLRAYDKIKEEESYYEIDFNSKISSLLQCLKLDGFNCNFFYRNQLVNQDKTFQEIEFQEMDTIEYEILNKKISLIQITLIQKNQQEEIELDQDLTIKDLRQKLNIRTIDEAELLLNNQTTTKDEQKLKDIAKDGKLTLTLKERIIKPQQQNKCALIISIKDIKYQIEFEQNKKVEDLRLFIINQYQQQNDIVIRYGKTILNPSDPIPNQPDLLIVSPFTLKVIIKINKLNQIQQRQFKPNQKIGDIIQDFVNQYKIKNNSTNLAWNGQILDVNKTLKESGVTDGTELNLLI
ncbi:unnamed protein product [Paramecium pentaurelia]|uniref:Ubiquitin-like domain-containing protein n=1 Tax=Paramecium pentaurelia TaxID=43138 RepID=A0A8S1XZ06_9CILI|nr:unnamed protein product [Paramecium pentaurelia]